MKDSKLININTFVLIYSLFGILSSIYHACFTAALTTLEKRYHFSSSTAGYIMIADNIATLVTTIFAGHYGKTAHKPRWMALATAISGLSVMTTALPYFLFGSIEEHELEMLAKNATLSRTSHLSGDQLCMEKREEEDCRDMVAASFKTTVAIVFFFFSNLFRGVGTSIYMTYGIPYLDDNIKRRRASAYFGFIFGTKMMGAPLGYILSGMFLKLYENPLVPPADLSNNDPRWIGAWWIGFLIAGFLMMILAIPTSLFPREFNREKKKKQKMLMAQLLPEELSLVAADTASSPNNGYLAQLASKEHDKGRTTQNDDGEEVEHTKLSQLPRDVWEIISNPLVCCQLVGNVCRGLGIAGYFVFQSRYLESQFKQPAAKASFLTGTTGVLPKIAGVFFGGVLISVLRPKSRQLTTFLFIVEATSVFGLLYASTLHGPIYSFPFTTQNADGQLELNNQCNRKCNCDLVKYQPVCDYSGANTYFSPCHAGCNISWSHIDGGDTYGGCDCLADNTRSLSKCVPDTRKLMEYVSVIAIGVMIAGSGRSGNMLTFVRSVTKEQKSLATAIQSFCYSLLVSIPYPLIYSRLFDSNCLVWSRECGKRGNCWLYDTERLRKMYHGLAIVLIALGSFFDFIMIFLSPRLVNLYDDDEDKSTLKERLMFWKSASHKKGTKQSTSNSQNPQPSKPLVTSL